MPFVTSIEDYEEKQNEYLNGKLIPDYKIQDFCQTKGENSVSLIIKKLESYE